jgi:manganese/zinc/iron transport system permease protein
MVGPTGMVAGIIGSYLSFLGSRLPTGPLIVLTSTLLFILALFFHPENGLLFKWLRLRGKERKIALENTLKAVYQELEWNNFSQDTVRLGNLAKRRRVSMPEMHLEAIHLVKKDFAFLMPVKDQGTSE